MPQTTFTITTGNNDWFLLKEDPKWPPILGTRRGFVGDGVEASKSNYLPNQYTVRNAFSRFDTSGLLDDAAVMGATLRLYVTAGTSGDGREVHADWKVWDAVVRP
jgi:hypothetical protein